MEVQLHKMWRYHLSNRVVPLLSTKRPMKGRYYFSTHVLPQLRYNVEKHVLQHRNPVWVHHCKTPFEWPQGSTKWYRLKPYTTPCCCGQLPPSFIYSKPLGQY